MSGMGAATALPPADCDTFPKLLEYQRRTRPNAPAIREKDFGIWQTYNWGHVAQEVRDLAAGLFNLGVQRGDKVAIVGDNRPRLYWTMTAVQAIGAVPVPLYQDSVAEEMTYVLEHAEARFAVVEDQEQVDKLLEVKERCPRLEQIVYDEDGQLLTASFMDYQMPRADGLPSFLVESHPVPTKVNRLGVKGAGEAGSIGSCPAVMNALVDALNRGYGIAHIDMPATQEKIWAAANEGRLAAAE